MAQHKFMDDVAEWDISSGGTLSEDLEIWFQRFLHENPYRKKKITPKTKKDYGDAFSTFVEFAQQFDGDIGITGMTSRFINRYLIWYQEQLAKKAYETKKIDEDDLAEVLEEGKKKRLGVNDSEFTIFDRYESTMSQRLVVVKALCSFISSENRQLHDLTILFRSVAKIKIGAKLTSHLSPKELKDLIELMMAWPEIYKQYKPKSSLFYAWRNSALILLYALSGARTSELLHVRLKDMRLVKDDGEEFISFKILKGKGGKRRTSIVEARFFLRHYEYLAATLPDPDYYISAIHHNGNVENKRMSDKSIRDFFNEAMVILGLDRSGLHTTRRAYVSKRIGVDNIDVSVVAKEVGNTVSVLEEHYLKADEEMLIRAKKKRRS